MINEFDEVFSSLIPAIIPKWPIWEQFFLSEESDWLANSRGEGRGSPIIFASPPPHHPTTTSHSQRCWEQYLEMLQNFLGIREELEKGKQWR